MEKFSVNTSGHTARFRPKYLNIDKEIILQNYALHDIITLYIESFYLWRINCCIMFSTKQDQHLDQ
jgi:hypothetical protein